MKVLLIEKPCIYPLKGGFAVSVMWCGNYAIFSITNKRITNKSGVPLYGWLFRMSWDRCICRVSVCGVEVWTQSWDVTPPLSNTLTQLPLPSNVKNISIIAQPSKMTIPSVFTGKRGVKTINFRGLNSIDGQFGSRICHTLSYRVKVRPLLTKVRCEKNR